MILIQPQATEQSIPCLNLSGLQITRAQFQQLCEANPDLRMELSRNGELIVMAPTFSISGERNANLNGQLWVWNDRTNLGKVFDSNTGYDFAAVGGGILAPDCKRSSYWSRFKSILSDFARLCHRTTFFY
jgi:Uma2 family endonuclease